MPADAEQRPAAVAAQQRRAPLSRAVRRRAARPGRRRLHRRATRCRRRRGAGQARADGMRLAFVTNNAARPPAAVAEHLTELGVPAEPAEVTTSSQAAAHYLAERLPAGAKVLVVGTVGLIEALRERGLHPGPQRRRRPGRGRAGLFADDRLGAAGRGRGRDQRGLPWVATNLDPTVPSPRGPLPGNGSLVAALRHATGVAPVATGKPDPTMHRESVERSGAPSAARRRRSARHRHRGRPRGRLPSLLVLTGVTTPDRPARGPARSPPGLRRPRPARAARRRTRRPTPAGGGLPVRPVAGRRDRAAADRRRAAAPTADRTDDADLQALRALCAASWAADDGRCGHVARAGDDASAAGADSAGPRRRGKPAHRPGRFERDTVAEPPRKDPP